MNEKKHEEIRFDFHDLNYRQSLSFDYETGKIYHHTAWYDDGGCVCNDRVSHMVAPTQFMSILEEFAEKGTILGTSAMVGYISSDDDYIRDELSCITPEQVREFVDRIRPKDNLTTMEFDTNSEITSCDSDTNDEVRNWKNHCYGFNSY